MKIKTEVAVRKRAPQPSIERAALRGNGKAKTAVTSILITQVRPDNERNPYSDLARKYGVTIDFAPFIHLQPLTCREFRRQKIYPEQYSALVFTSKSMIDQFFRLCEDLRVRVSPECRYYCISEAVALYLQKYIVFRKRKVFYGDGRLESLLENIERHHHGENYLITCADQHRTDIADFLKKKKYEFAEAVLFKTVLADIREKELRRYDMLVFFTPAGILALFQRIPDFKQRSLLIGTYGEVTLKAAEEAGLRVQVSAPAPGLPSMAMALDRFLGSA